MAVSKTCVVMGALDMLGKNRHHIKHIEQLYLVEEAVGAAVRNSDARRWPKSTSSRDAVVILHCQLEVKVQFRIIRAKKYSAEVRAWRSSRYG